jgi:peptidyl-prolyl cis-trans isomerase C
MMLSKPRAALAALAILCATAVQAQDADTVVARVNGEEITLGHMILLYERLPDQMRATLGPDLYDQMLTQLIEQTAVAITAGDLTAREQKFLDNSRREFVTNSRLTVIAEAAISDEALQTAYESRFADTESRREFNASHILVATLEEAETLLAQLADGGNFAALARELSLDPGSGAEGGVLGWFGRGRMVAPFEEAVLTLDEGALSDPVETQFGWHIIRLNESRVAEAPTLDAVREELVREVQIGAVMAQIEEIIAESEVERVDTGIDPMLLQDQTLMQQ